MAFLGVTHGTTSVRWSLLDGNGSSSFSIARESGKDPQFMERLAEVIDPRAVKKAAIAYSMGDGICAVTPIGELGNRGVLSLEGIGDHRGTGTAVFDELMGSGMDCVVVPGLHQGCDYLDPGFRRLYSHCAAPKKVCAAYHVLGAIRDGSVRDIPDNTGNMIVTSVSSNTVSLLVRDGKLVGGIDATTGAPGMSHGPLDVESIRRAAATGDVNKEFFTSGIFSRSHQSPEEFMNAVAGGHRGVLDGVAALVLAVAMEINGLASISDGVRFVALTGTIGCKNGILDFRKELKRFVDIPILQFPVESAPLGAARIARDVDSGAGDIMGIPVAR